MSSARNNKRVLIKLTGRAFAGRDRAIDFEMIEKIAHQIKRLIQAGLEIAVVTGGGNVYKGNWLPGKMKSNSGHHMGLLATVINAVALSEALEAVGQPTLMQSFWHFTPFIPAYNRAAANRALVSGKVLVVGGGTGRPGLSTDTGSAELAHKINASEVWKASNVKGVYSADPNGDGKAKLIKKITLTSAIRQNLGFADRQALEYSLANNIGWRIFDYFAGDLKHQLTASPPGSQVVPQ